MTSYKKTFYLSIHPSGVSTSVSTIKKLMQWCIHLLEGMNDEKKLVYKGGWF
jgi:hypothetical protein